MAGIVVFTSISAAISAGFQVYDRTERGFLVRMNTAEGWAIAFVELSTS